MSQEVIRLQGKAYDAVTGSLVRGTAQEASSRHADPTIRSSQAHPSSTHPQRSGVNPLKAHAVQPAHTLMRRAVQKPGQSLKRQVHVQSALTHPGAAAITVKHSVSHVDPERLSKAQQIQKYYKVNRFGEQTDIAIKFAPIPVQPLPDTIPSNDPPATPPPMPTNKPVDIFEHALANATNFVDLQAHKQYFKKKTRRHMLSVASGALALLLIAGFAAYQNTPGLQIKVAGYRAGVATATPNFAASGFAYNGTKADHARLVIGLKGNGANYQLSEQSTNWSGQDMIDQVSSVNASGEANYTTLQAANSTVYRLSGSQATWVKDGIWYQVSGTKSLTDTQLKSLVQNS